MNWRYVHLFIGLFFLIISLFFQQEVFNYTAIGVTTIMVYWWITQPIPLYLTALIPIVIGVPLNLITYESLAEAYGNKMVFLFFGGFVIALAIEKWHLHRFFAEKILVLFGNSPKQLLAGFMVSTAFLSMWISNTATALMILPMALSVIQSIPRFRLKKKFAIALLLGVAFAANIGGTATLVGTPPNVQMAGILSQYFDIEVNFIHWFKIGFPFMLILLSATYFVLRWIFLKNIYFELPQFNHTSLNTNQLRVLIIFITVVIFWISGTYMNKLIPISLNDTSTALMGAMLMFIIPAKSGKPLLVWGDMNKLPWGILFLFGGGLALANILSNTGVLNHFVLLLSELNFVPYFLLLLLIFTVTIFATELMSNLALVSLMIPVMAQFAVVSGNPVFHISAGIALCSSCAFMLPVATPPNAIIYSSNLLKVKTMAKVGIILNLLTILLVTCMFWVLE